MRNPKLLALIGLTTVCAAASVAFIAYGTDDGGHAVADPGSARAAGASTSDPARPSPLTAGAIVFRSLDRRDEAHYGYTAIASAGAPARRRLAPLVCARVHFAAGRGLCLEPAGTLIEQGVTILGRRLDPLRTLTLNGVPSRARVSPDGRYGAVTFFVYGHSYATPGSFSTATTIIDLKRMKTLANLESFRIERNGKRFDSPDFNFWGMTFAADGDRFYATLSSRGTTYLVEGSVAARSARVLREDVECPSLSPDGSRIAFKLRTGKGKWRLHVLDVGTLQARPLAETRSVDDQAEWLDDERVLYGRDGAVWVVRADGSGAPTKLLGDADSPAVVRDPDLASAG